MAEEAPTIEAGKGQLKRRLGRKKAVKSKKKMKVFHGTGEKKVKINDRMRKLYRKRAREYNSDDDESAPTHVGENTEELLDNNKVSRPSREREAEDEENERSEEEHDEIQPGVTKFTEGCRAFRIAFKKIIKRSVPDDSLGPVLSAHKKLVVEKLAEEDTERKAKGEAKKEKHLLGEKGHVKPDNFLDSHEKFLIGVATKGVVKLFNAVNKAQNAQKGLNPSRSKDAKVLRKRRKEVFFSELGKTPSAETPAQDPGWAPLRDGYMLTSSKLKNWDKMASSDAIIEDNMPIDTSSDDDED